MLNYHSIRKLIDKLIKGSNIMKEILNECFIQVHPQNHKWRGHVKDIKFWVAEYTDLCILKKMGPSHGIVMTVPCVILLVLAAVFRWEDNRNTKMSTSRTGHATAVRCIQIFRKTKVAHMKAGRWQEKWVIGLSKVDKWIDKKDTQVPEFIAHRN